MVPGYISAKDCNNYSTSFLTGAMFLYLIPLLTEEMATPCLTSIEIDKLERSELLLLRFFCFFFWRGGFDNVQIKLKVYFIVIQFYYRTVW